MSGSDSVCIRPMASEDLQCVLAWRNHPEIRRFMLTQHEISLSEHRKWFDRATDDPTRRLLIVENDQAPLGYAQFTNVASGGIANWGFYAAPGAGKGAGRRIGSAALGFAFQRLTLHKVCGQALGFNVPSIRCHNVLGFRQEGILRDQCLIGGTYYDLICFGLLAREWVTRLPG